MPDAHLLTEYVVPFFGLKARFCQEAGVRESEPQQAHRAWQSRWRTRRQSEQNQASCVMSLWISTIRPKAKTGPEGVQLHCFGRTFWARKECNSRHRAAILALPASSLEIAPSLRRTGTFGQRHASWLSANDTDPRPPALGRCCGRPSGRRDALVRRLHPDPPGVPLAHRDLMPSRGSGSRA